MTARPVPPAAAAGSPGRWARPQEMDMSVSAYILIQTEVGRAATVARTVQDLDGVVTAEGVTGPTT